MIRLFSLLIIYISVLFYTTDTYAKKGELQYCFYKGRWSQIFKERNYISNTRWQNNSKMNNPNLYNDIFRKSIGLIIMWIETKTLEK